MALNAAVSLLADSCPLRSVLDGSFKPNPSMQPLLPRALARFPFTRRRPARRRSVVRRRPLLVESLESRELLAHNITVVASGGTATLAQLSSFADTADYTVNASVLAAASAPVTLQADTDVIFQTSVTLATGVPLNVQAGRSIVLNASVFTSNANLSLTANETAADGVVGAFRDAGAASIAVSTDSINLASGGSLSIRLLDARAIRITMPLPSSWVSWTPAAALSPSALAQAQESKLKAPSMPSRILTSMPILPAVRSCCLVRCLPTRVR